MRKELILVKDLYDNWSCVWCVSHTEGKNIKNAADAIDLIKNTYPELQTKEFFVEGIEIFFLVSDEMPMINPGERCK
jgi:hypothetical protein